jgi:type I restriction enzyme M protein
MSSSSAVRFAPFLHRMSDILRDTISRRNQPDILLHFLLLRWLDCAAVSGMSLGEGGIGKRTGREPTTRFETWAADPLRLPSKVRAFIDEQGEALKAVLGHLQLHQTIDLLETYGLLAPVVAAFSSLDLTDTPNLGPFVEAILYDFRNANDFAEFFTPKDVISLIAALVREEEVMEGRSEAERSVYDCCCGTSGLLFGVADELSLHFPHLLLALYGQEVNATNYALSAVSLHLRRRNQGSGEICLGNTLSTDQFAGKTFDYLAINPPYGLSWKGIRREIEREAKQGAQGRFGAGLPNVDDGQCLFLQHVLAHMKPPEEGGSLAVVVLNGSPLFHGGVESGENRLRRLILERGLLRAIIALPEHLFFNTGIATYLWVLTTKPARQDQVQIIDATACHQPLRRNLGEKRCELSPQHIADLIEIYHSRKVQDSSRLCPGADFGFREIVVERPLRLSFSLAPQRLERLAQQKVWDQTDRLPEGAPADLWSGAEACPEPRRLQVIEGLLKRLPGFVYKDQSAFLADMRAVALACGIHVSRLEWDAVIAALGERDEEAEPCRNARGGLVADPQLRDREHVPLAEDVHAFLEREVKPYVPDAWIDEAFRDEADGQIGKVGYEINARKLFYRYVPLRSLEEITADLLALEQEIQESFR